MLFANRLEQPRTHVLTEQDVEQSQREAAFVLPGGGPKSQGDMGLLGFFGVQQPAGFFRGGRSGLCRRVGALAESSDPSIHLGEQVCVSQVAGGSDDDGSADVSTLEEPQQVFPTESSNRACRTDHRASQWVLGKLDLIEEVMHQFGWLVAVHGLFFQDDIPFLGNLRRGKLGFEKHVAEHVEQLGQPGRHRSAVEAGVFLVGEGIEIATDPLDILRNPRGRPSSRSLEEHVLDEVGGPILAGSLVSPAGVDPNAHRHAGQVRQGGCHYAQTAGEF